MVEWLERRGLMVLNEGDTTRVERGTGRESTPDITLCSEGWEWKWEWEVLNGKMGSDHRPIVVALEEGKKMGTSKWVRWDWY